MSEIEKLRAEMDQVHIELAGLLKKRLALVRQIWQIKKSQQIPFLDSGREEMILQQAQSFSVDTEEQNFLHNVFKNILIETKKNIGKEHQ